MLRPLSQGQLFNGLLSLGLFCSLGDAPPEHMGILTLLYDVIHISSELLHFFFREMMDMLTSVD